MPYKSDAQRRWAHTKAGTKALGGPEKVSEWDRASKGDSLPDHAGSEEMIRAIRQHALQRLRELSPKTPEASDELWPGETTDLGGFAIARFARTRAKHKPNGSA